jgi:hypothetical protein
LSGQYPFNGPLERRGNTLIVMADQREQLQVLRTYLDPRTSDEQIGRLMPRWMVSSGEFDAASGRRLLAGNAAFGENRIVRYPFKPFDVRLAYLDAALAPLFSRPRPSLLAQASIAGNTFLVSRDTADQDPEGSPFLFTRLICDYDCLSGHARLFPMGVTLQTARGRPRAHPRQLSSDTEISVTGNLSDTSLQYVRTLGITHPRPDVKTAEMLWMHVLAIGYSPMYLEENADGVKQDWPRVPLPDKHGPLEVSATLGREVAALLDTESEVRGVTTGRIRPELASMARPSRDDGGSLDPDKDLAVTANWGHAGKGGVTMPGKGDARERDYMPDEKKAIVDAAERLGLSQKEAFARLGKTTFDIYLNGVAFWKNVPRGVWEFYIGGYQVVKKWLSYREEKLLGRPLKSEEAEHVMNTCRRLAALILLGPRLDANYQAVKKSTYKWPALDARP